MYSVIYVIIWEQFVRWVGDVWVGGNVGGGGIVRRVLSKGGEMSGYR